MKDLLRLSWVIHELLYIQTVDHSSIRIDLLVSDGKMAKREIVTASFEGIMKPPARDAPKNRSALYFYDYTNKVWRAAACDEEGKLIPIEA